MATLLEVKQEKFEEINKAFDTAKQEGAQSRALNGIVHIYSIDDADMLQFNSMVTASMLSRMQGQTRLPILAMNNDGIWAFRLHNIPQIEVAASDVYKQLAVILTRKQELIDALMAANTIEDVIKIHW
jgi:hypothetical protein